MAGSEVGRHGTRWMISLPRRLDRVGRVSGCGLDERRCGAHRIEREGGDDDEKQVASIMIDGHRVMVEVMACGGGGVGCCRVRCVRKTIGREGSKASAE